MRRRAPKGRPTNLIRRSAGLWGPAGFAVAALSAAMDSPGYSHREHHISGLAASGSRSARRMVPGFIALAAAQAVMPTPSRSLRRVIRAAAATTLAAGLVQVSDPSCPTPGIDSGATGADVGHGAASIATFVLWSTMPVLAARDQQLAPWYRRCAHLMTMPNIAALLAAGLTTRKSTNWKGAAQRAHLTTVFAFLAATGHAGNLHPPSRA